MGIMYISGVSLHTLSFQSSTTVAVSILPKVTTFYCDFLNVNYLTKCGFQGKEITLIAQV